MNQRSYFLNARPARRLFDRYKMVARVAVTAADGTLYRGWSNNVSEGGISATFAACFQADTELTVHLTLPDSDDAIQMRAVVRHVDGFRHGLQFLSLSSQQRALIHRFVAGREDTPA